MLINLLQNSLSETRLQIEAAPRIEVAICFFYGPPYTQHFKGAMSFKPFFLGGIWEKNLSFLIIVFHHL